MIALLAYADLAHLVERRLAKAKVAGSSPVIRSIKQKHMASAMCFLFSFADYGAYEPDPRKAYSTAPLVVFHNYRRQNCATVQKSFTAIDNAVVR